MNKTIAFFITICLLFSFCACGGENADENIDGHYKAVNDEFFNIHKTTGEYVANYDAEKRDYSLVSLTIEGNDVVFSHYGEEYTGVIKGSGDIVEGREISWKNNPLLVTDSSLEQTTIKQDPDTKEIVMEFRNAYTKESLGETVVRITFKLE